MATYVDVIKFESEKPGNIIRLVKSGEFYRAYNHSAWLFQSCITEHKVMRKFVKALKCDIYYIGFPERSLLNNIGERKFTKTDMGYDVELSADEMPDENGYETWKATVTTDVSSKGDYNSLPLAGVAAEREVIKQLREYPLENKSMLECTIFLASLRRILNNT